MTEQPEKAPQTGLRELIPLTRHEQTALLLLGAAVVLLGAGIVLRRSLQTPAPFHPGARPPSRAG